MAEEWLLLAGSVLLLGSPGSRPSTVLNKVVSATDHLRALRCTGAIQDAGRPLCGLTRLLSTVEAAELADLPTVYRRLLAASVFHPIPGGARIPTLAVGRAVLRLLRVMCRRGPVLFVIDQAQWLDRESAAVLRFVATRADDLPVQVLAAECLSGKQPPTGHHLCPSPLLVLDVESGADRRI